jgi:hypothetical protein
VRSASASSVSRQTRPRRFPGRGHRAHSGSGTCQVVFLLRRQTRMRRTYRRIRGHWRYASLRRKASSRQGTQRRWRRRVRAGRAWGGAAKIQLQAILITCFGEAQRPVTVIGDEVVKSDALGEAARLTATLARRRINGRHLMKRIFSPKVPAPWARCCACGRMTAVPLSADCRVGRLGGHGHGIFR